MTNTQYKKNYAYFAALILFLAELAKCTENAQQMLDTGNLTCYECNVWKAGFGNECQVPRKMDGCFTCMKLETTIFIAYYKNTPRYSTQISRVCGKPRSIRYHTGCLHFKSVDGFSKRCYCSTDLCNSAHRLSRNYMAPIIGTVALSLMRLL